MSPSTVSITRMSLLPLDRLELLERLPAALAVAERAARRRPEDVLEARLRRAAVRAPVHLRLELHERRCGCLARRGRRESRGASLLAAGRSDAVGRPGVVLDHLDLGLAAEGAHLLLQRVLHLPERRAA